MSLKNDIEYLFFKNTNYAEPEQAINQAESLKSLSVDLYTDSKRFVYELLQNADDSAISGTPVKVGVRLFDDFLVVAHTGKPFDKRDLRGICAISDGTKKNSVEKTGYKGIGFKAVFGQSNKVAIYTNGEYFRFDSEYDFDWKEAWGDNQTDWESENERQFSYPWQIIPIYTPNEEIDVRIKNFLDNGEWTVATIVLLSKGKDAVKTAIEKLSSNINMFLFLKNIEELDFDIGTSNIITLHRVQENQTVEIKQNGNIKASWLLRTVKLEVPSDVKSELKEERNIPEKLLHVDNTELTFAAKIGEYGIKKLNPNESLLYSYLPTAETKYKIPVLVNSSFVIGANRETLHENSKWNEWLFKNIPLELLKWIAELVKSKYKYQAYELIPSSITGSSLFSCYRQGMSNAFDTIPFILSNQLELMKTNQAIVDCTSVSKEGFITEGVVRDFVIKKSNRETIHENPFLPFNIYEEKLKSIGVASFEWSDIPKLLESKIFLKSHTASDNTQLIEYFKQLNENKNLSDITESVIKSWSFILDHKGKLQDPNDIYFPTLNKDDWDNPNSETSFVHHEIQCFLLKNIDIKIWLENLGVNEKTDLTYLRKTIIENASTYCTHENSIETISKIFSLYLKEEIKQDELSKLSELKILTENGNLLPAKACYLSDSYYPRLKLQSVLSDDVFVSIEYIKNTSEKEELKRFFKMMGVKEGITPVTYDKISTSNLIQQHQFKNDYFEEDDKYFKPVVRTFCADEYLDLTTLIFLPKTSGYDFSKLLWSDLIENTNLNRFNSPATAYWGDENHRGRTLGNNVVNYTKWYTKNIDCIPTLMKICCKAGEIFINSESIVKLAGNYLPVFDGPELSPDYKSFFDFKPSLKLSDYLVLLNRISLDTRESKVKKDNKDRIQSIYKILIESSVNWSEIEIQEVDEWANTNSLLNTKNQFTDCNNIKFFLDGNESIFQDQFEFVNINPENKANSNLEVFLSYFKVTILKQTDFELECVEEEVCLSLKSRLKSIIPFFKLWIEYEAGNDNNLENLQNRIDSLDIYQADELKIKYTGIDFIKNVNVHFNKTSLYVTKPWSANNVLLKLPEVLCRYLRLVGHDKKLEFLLRSTSEEIQEYFEQENINIPEGVLDLISITNTKVPNLISSSKSEKRADERLIHPKFYHISKSDYNSLNYAKQIIKRAVINVIKHLEICSEYDCSNYYEIAESIIGGITKNGNEITVVARPSDEDFILLYYTSEFDVLEYTDAELWCEDGLNQPEQITLGQLLKMTGINRIPVRNINISDIETSLNTPKDEELDFDAIPFAPQKIAKIISSFANTNGGILIFGLKEINITTNEVVGLSANFRIVEVTKKAISLLSPIPKVTYDWVQVNEKSVFVIKTVKADNDVFFNNQKYIRKEASTEAEENISNVSKTLAVQQFSKTIAIIIGIENYALKKEHQISPVKYANNDALKFKKMLIERMNVDENNIYTFLNEEALKSSLEYDLSRLFHFLTEEDRLVFYFVGHGFHNGVTNYLSTYDMHKHHIAETAVSLNKVLLDPLRKSKCKTAHIFIDACAKSFIDENERSEISNINYEELILLTSELPYYAIFLSCQTGQSSYSSDVLENGIWTYHLVKAISGDVPEVINSNKYITDRSLSDYLSSSVTAYTKQELEYDQNPKAILDSSNENVIAEIQ